MHKVNGKTVDLGRELREAIEQRFALAPIIVLGPIAADLLDPLQRHALAPVADRLGLQPAGVPQPGSEIIEHIVADRDAIGLDFRTHERPLRRRTMPCFTRQQDRDGSYCISMSGDVGIGAASFQATFLHHRSSELKGQFSARLRILAAHITPELCGGIALRERGRREDRAPAGTHGPRATKKARGRTTGSAEITRPSLRNGFNGLLRALPGDRALLPPSPAESSSADLTPASGCQDHTILPSAATSLVRSLGDRSREHKNPPCDPVARKTLPRPPHPVPR